MPPVDCCDLGFAEALGCRDDRRVDRSERQVVVLRHQLDHAERVSRVDGFEHERAGGEIAEEAGFSLPAEARAEEVGDLGDDERGNDEGAGVRLQQFEARRMVRVVRVDVRIERAGVDDQRDGADSARMISSTRSEMSVRPLRPAAAAPSRRRSPPPRCASSALRVISAMVVPRRCASWRRRASRSSGSFTVVRTMGCQHTSQHTRHDRQAPQAAKDTPRGSGCRGTVAWRYVVLCGYRIVPRMRTATLQDAGGQRHVLNKRATMGLLSTCDPHAIIGIWLP